MFYLICSAVWHSFIIWRKIKKEIILILWDGYHTNRLVASVRCQYNAELLLFRRFFAACTIFCIQLYWTVEITNWRACLKNNFTPIGKELEKLIHHTIICSLFRFAAVHVEDTVDVEKTIFFFFFCEIVNYTKSDKEVQ